jgi:hypothetical protein
VLTSVVAELSDIQKKVHQLTETLVVRARCAVWLLTNKALF